MRSSTALRSLLGLATLTSQVQGLQARDGDEKELVEFTLWSTPHCGQNSKEDWTSKDTTINTWKTTAEWINCGVTNLGLGDWPVSKQGDYITYIDSGKIEDKCQLIFYHFPEQDDEVRGSSSCFMPFRMISPSTGSCEKVTLPPKYGLVYCCGDDCNGPSPRTKRDESSAAAPVAHRSSVRDVTKVKRGPITRRLVEPSFFQKRDEDCKFVKTSDSKLTYSKPKVFTDPLPCGAESDSDCSFTKTYETSIGITTSKSSSNTITGGVSGGSPFFQVTAEYGHEWSESREDSEETTTGIEVTQHVAPGTRGLLLYSEKLYCGEGYFEGDGCGEEVQGDAREWCVPAMRSSKSGKPEPVGLSSIYTVD